MPESDIRLAICAKSAGRAGALGRQLAARQPVRLSTAAPCKGMHGEGAPSGIGLDSGTRAHVDTGEGGPMDFDATMLARIQFGFTISFHIIFPAFTIGLSAFIATLLVMWKLT